jgi:hypothetical protein
MSSAGDRADSAIYIGHSRDNVMSGNGHWCPHVDGHETWPAPGPVPWQLDCQCSSWIVHWVWKGGMMLEVSFSCQLLLVSQILGSLLSDGPHHISVDRFFRGDQCPHISSIHAVQSCSAWSLAAMFPWGLQPLPQATSLVVLQPLLQSLAIGSG